MKTEYDFSKGKRGLFFHDGAKPTFPAPDKKSAWTGPDGELGGFIKELTRNNLNAYRAQPNLITEHANLEYGVAHGGYAHRQLFELVQNSADALLDAPAGKSILIRLTNDTLYCADDGAPIDEAGIYGLTFSRMSSKSNTDAIGRFGLGFKSVLGVTDAPEFYSRPVSFRFDRTNAAERIGDIMRAPRYPVLRLPETIDPRSARETDEELRELMSWATNIVRLPLKPGAYDDLARQIEEFPPEFLLFVDHVRYLTLQDGDSAREFVLQNHAEEFCLDTGGEAARWRRFRTTCRLSGGARNDASSLQDSDEVLISWAVPLDRVTDPGRFWAFFPTMTTSLVAGILNAPWKTNEDRQNLLPGPYNDELIEAAAKMIADELPGLATPADPARHLDALPRREERGDSEQSVLLRKCLSAHLRKQAIVPDQDGQLRTIQDILYPPKKMTDSSHPAAFKRWAEYPGRPRNWLHHKALTRNRLASIDRLFPPRWQGDSSAAPRTTIADWLEALVRHQEADNSVDASMAAIQTAIAIPPEIRSNERLGDIVFTASGEWRALDPQYLFLSEDVEIDMQLTDTASHVHPELVSDVETLSALRKFGLRPTSPDESFRLVAKQITTSQGEPCSNDDLHCKFWILSRCLPLDAARTIVRDLKDWRGQEIWSSAVRVRTLADNWRLLCSALLPGDIVPGDGTEDDDATIDTCFHRRDLTLLKELAVVAAACETSDPLHEPRFSSFRDQCRNAYYNQTNLPHRPEPGKLNFESPKYVGPLEVLTVLSDGGAARYTAALLELDACYEPWTMWHTGTNRNIYPKKRCESFATYMLREHGRIGIANRFVPLQDALGSEPRNPDALHALLRHPKADKIREVFDLSEPVPEFSGEDDPVPLIDVWPGLAEYLPTHRRQCHLVHCRRILVVGQSRECIFHAGNVYLSDAIDDDEQGKLELVAGELELGLSNDEAAAVLQRRTPSEIKERRDDIRENSSTDAERLLSAVGEQGLRRGVSESLLRALEIDGVALTDIETAEAAIATYHTDALRQYKNALDHLDPPVRWAGSARAVSFVTSLGFSVEWAGERVRKRDPFVEIDGPYPLPELHDYQKIIVNNVRDMLRSGHGNGDERRGMISMPTGSGKTRVAVQAVVEAIREDGFGGGVLWVADRDELCEQAVVAWTQVWSSLGAPSARLRISRMWEGQPRPLPTAHPHVVVATVQTLKSRLDRHAGDYGFLADFKLAVFDEAHRSLAPTVTSVMEHIGLTRLRREDEPFLLGLTATPYRGHDEEETKRLVRRYGSRRLDHGAFDRNDSEAVVRELQERRVLARADHRTIEGGEFSVHEIMEALHGARAGEREWEDLLSLPWLPRSVEERIAGNAQRTGRIVEAYKRYIDPDWPTLIFATSVEHAQTMAALLNRTGILSRAVSGKTGTATRRRVVEKFRGGEIKVLVNYGVFREGFDAPRTRAIIVARPVYSPNLYFQMIGRGLRGPLNGGDERCLILDVRDNIENFDRRLAFSELDWLWTA